MLNKLLSLRHHAGFMRYFKNAGWMMGEQILRMTAGLFVGIWVARYLGPEQFGIFSYALAFTSIFAGIAKLGLDGIIVRELINNPEQHNVYLGTAFWLKVMGSGIVVLLLAVIAPFTSNDSTTNLYIFIIASGLVFQSFEVVEFYFQSQVLAKIVSICKVIQLIASSVIKIYLVLTGAELIWFILVTAFDTFSLAISYFIAYRLKKGSSFYIHFNFHVAKKLLKDSLPLMFSVFVVTIYMRIDQIMIKEILGEYEVGIYSAAVRLNEVFYFIPTIITASVFPSIMKSKQYNEKHYHEKLQQLYTLMIWLAISIALLITTSGEWLTLALFGLAYKSSTESLMILTWSGVFVFLGVAFSKYLIIENLTIISFQRTLLGATTNVVLNLFLIGRYGIIGAAISTLIAQFVANYFYDIFDRRLYHQFYLKNKSFFMPHQALKFK